jgi:hypothetical protein
MFPRMVTKGSFLHVVSPPKKDYRSRTNVDIFVIRLLSSPLSWLYQNFGKVLSEFFVLVKKKNFIFRLFENVFLAFDNVHLDLCGRPRRRVQRRGWVYSSPPPSQWRVFVSIAMRSHVDSGWNCDSCLRLWILRQLWLREEQNITQGLFKFFQVQLFECSKCFLRFSHSQQVTQFLEKNTRPKFCILCRVQNEENKYWKYW